MGYKTFHGSKKTFIGVQRNLIFNVFIASNNLFSELCCGPEKDRFGDRLEEEMRGTS